MTEGIDETTQVLGTEAVILDSSDCNSTVTIAILDVVSGLWGLAIE